MMVALNAARRACFNERATDGAMRKEHEICMDWAKAGGFANGGDCRHGPRARIDRQHPVRWVFPTGG